ncbi:hypothetical protein CRG98_018140 [Punica granatum]|uniref:Uncharacterized protein n=1 Tax=Punica granatum TaxID=22663 RepID=A0A2I0JYN2_PUNGR|nr:hypothetical protein CRG98_018140 [Punica granatum]
MANNSAATAKVQPISQENPTSHLPSSFQIIPPAPANPGLPLPAPSILSFTQPREELIRDRLKEAAVLMITAAALSGLEKFGSNSSMLRHDHHNQQPTHQPNERKLTGSQRGREKKETQKNGERWTPTLSEYCSNPAAHEGRNFPQEGHVYTSCLKRNSTKLKDYL